MTYVAMLAAGFSVVIGPLLLAAYIRGSHMPKRTPFSITTCLALTACVVIIQVLHLNLFTSDAIPTDTAMYRACISLAPAAFFLFARSIVLPDEPPTIWLALHLLPFALSWLLPANLALPVLFVIGAGYAVWLSAMVVTVRKTYKQHGFELLLSIVIVISAALVLLAGSIAGTGSDFFYIIYSVSIGIAYAMITFALVAIPDLLNDLFEVTKSRYAVSTLNNVGIESALQKLEQLMNEQQLYRDEDLSLASLAAEVDLSAHQLSELINQHLGCSFSQYLKNHRVTAAKDLLTSSPDQSVLSIGLEVGFRSQSSFYTAFREATGTSPGNYRSKPS